MKKVSKRMSAAAKNCRTRRKSRKSRKSRATSSPSVPSLADGPTTSPLAAGRAKVRADIAARARARFGASP